jgi:hypothetical protein
MGYRRDFRLLREPLKKPSFVVLVVLVVLVVQMGNGYYINTRAHHKDHEDHEVSVSQRFLSSHTVPTSCADLDAEIECKASRSNFIVVSV